MKPDADLINTILDNLSSFSTVWVFGYGSLLWKPCFQFQRQVVGHIKGFKRRFYQGNTNFRGSSTQPGRVAILVPEKEEVTWGVAYEIRGSEHVREALEHLYLRENDKGGYFSMLTTFYPRQTGPKASGSESAPTKNASRTHGTTSDGESDVESDTDGYHTDVSMDSDVTDSEDDVPEASSSQPFHVLSFTATSASEQWLGEADMSVMARQVAVAKGQAGPNSEYVIKTADYIRHHIPEDHDIHLFELERRVREILAASGSDLAQTAAAAVVHDVQHHQLTRYHHHIETDLHRTPLTVGLLT